MCFCCIYQWAFKDVYFSMNSVNIYDIRHRWVNFNFISLFICMFMPMYTINYRHCMLKSVFLQPIKLEVWRMHTTHSQTFNYFNDNGWIQAKKLKEKKTKRDSHCTRIVLCHSVTRESKWLIQFSRKLL